MGQFAAGDWALSFEDLGFLGTLPPKICVEAALQLCSVRLSGRFIEDWATVDARSWRMSPCRWVWPLIARNAFFRIVQPGDTA